AFPTRRSSDLYKVHAYRVATGQKPLRDTFGDKTDIFVAVALGKRPPTDEWQPEGLKITWANKTELTGFVLVGRVWCFLEINFIDKYTAKKRELVGKSRVSNSRQRS